MGAGYVPDDAELQLFREQQLRDQAAASHMPRPDVAADSFRQMSNVGAAMAPMAAPPPAAAPLPAATAAPIGQAMALPAQAEPPPINTTDKRTQYSSSYTKMSPELTANLRQIQGLEEPAVDVAREKGTVGVEAAKIAEDRAADAEGHALKRVSDLTTTINAADERMADAEAKNRAAVNEHHAAVEAGSRTMWEDRGAAKHFFGALFIGLGTLGQGLQAMGGNSGARNTALDVIRDSVAQDAAKKRTRIEGARDQELMARTGLADATRAKQESLADVDRVAAAQWNYVASQYETKLAGLGKSKAEIDADAHVIEARKQALEYERKALAPTAREVRSTVMKDEKITTGKPGKFPGDDDEKVILKQFAADKALVEGTPRQPGPLGRLSAAEAVAHELKEAIASGEGARIKAAVASAREQSTRMLTGAAPTKQTAHLVSELQGDPAKFEAHIGQFVGNPTEGKQFATAILGLVEGIGEQQRLMVDDARGRTMKRYHGPNGLANTPVRERTAKGQIEALFGGVRNADGTPRYQEGGAAAKPEAAPKMSFEEAAKLTAAIAAGDPRSESFRAILKANGYGR